MPLPTSLSPQAHEELSQQNEAHHDWIEQLGAQDREQTSRGYQRMADLQVSTTDLDATLMQTKNGTDLGYHNPLCRRWEQIAHHLERPGDPSRGDGQSTHARPALANPLPLEAMAKAGDR